MDPSSNLTLSVSPHAHSGASVRRIMLDVIIAMIPAMVAAVYFFGWNAIRLMVVCTVTCVAAEAAVRTLMKRDIGIDDLSAVITGILLAFNLPPGLPTGMAVIGSLVAIIIAKQVYGGLGYNVFNPALVGRVVLLASFPVPMTTWLSSQSPGHWMDAATTATPLGEWKTSILSTGMPPTDYFDRHTLFNLLVGNHAGCIGETSVIAILIGGIYLLWRKCIYWQVPVFYIGTVIVFATILKIANPAIHLGPVYHALTGGLFLGAFFMATDMVTTPVTRAGMAVFGTGCGILTVVIRVWGGYPEGVSYSILIMNAFTPLINRATRPRVFGHFRKAAKAA